MAGSVKPVRKDTPRGKPRRYALVSSRPDGEGARIKRLRLARMEALAALEPTARTPKSPA